MKNALFVLGAFDPEMRSIRYMLGQAGYRTAVATKLGKRCSSSNAYSADSLSKMAADDQPRIWVECRSPEYVDGRDLVVDHHNEGDPGYEAPPAAYWEGSSIGQIAMLIGAKKNTFAKLAAASDHCLSAAMRGECGDVDPRELMEWRIKVRASMMELAPWQLRRRIDRAIERLESLPNLNLGGEKIIDGSFDTTPELRDAAAVAGRPILTTRLDVLGRVKLGLYGARKDLVTEWLDSMGKSSNVDCCYGNPNREYAGVVLNEATSLQMLRAHRMTRTNTACA